MFDGLRKWLWGKDKINPENWRNHDGSPALDGKPPFDSLPHKYRSIPGDVRAELANKMGE